MIEKEENIKKMIKSIKKDIKNLNDNKNIEFDIRDRISCEKERMIDALNWIIGKEDSMFISDSYNSEDNKNKF